MALRIIEVVLVKPKKFFVPFSWVIRIFQGFTEYSHCAFCFNISGDRMYYDARSPRVSFSNEYYFFDSYEVIRSYKIFVEEEKYLEIRKLVMDYAGAPYPLLENITMGISKLLGLNDNFYKDSRYLKCSELLANFLNKLFSIQVNAEMVDVRDIDNILLDLAQNQDSQVYLYYQKQSLTKNS